MIKDSHACTIAHMYTHCLTDSSYKHTHMTVMRARMINKSVRRNTCLEAQEKRTDYPSKRVQAQKNHIFVLHYVFLKNLSSHGVW